MADLNHVVSEEEEALNKLYEKQARDALRYKNTDFVVTNTSKRKTSVGNKIINGVIIAIFVIFALLCLYPFYYMIINSISANDLSANGFIKFLPHKIHFQNYIDVIQIRGMGKATMISLLRTVLGTVCTVFASAFLGYMFTQKKLWARKFWYRFFVVTMYFNAGLIPMYITMKTFHLTDNFLVYILPAIIHPFSIILVKTYIESIPESLQEAASIEGAGIFTIFMKIILPLSKPILATVAIFSIVNQWNAFQDTLLYITNQSLYSLQYLLYSYINQASSLASLVHTSGASAVANIATQQTPTSIRMTVSVIVVLPILFVYPLFQRFFIKGIMIGSVKG
ncbi:MAG: carbohydrate ABC transporter permease [Lachnospiraceae bacterium]|nr:carbohydrate ABC transporter permease [Lachnospiraceae bacterium]